MKQKSELFAFCNKIVATTIVIVGSSSNLTAQELEPPPGTPPGTLPGEGPGVGWSWVVPSVGTPAGGANGPNRRVSIARQTVSGTFSEPSHGLNPETTGTLGGVPDRKTNKTTFYLGGKTADNTVHIDAGMQWEPHEATGNETTYPAGWSLTINIAMGVDLPVRGKGLWRYTGNPKPPWRVLKGDLGSTTLGYKVNEDGQVSITANASLPEDGDKSVGPIPVIWPRKNDGSINISGMEVKRVVGLTQAFGPDVETGYVRLPSGQWTSQETTKINYDGSWVSNLYFLNGMVGTIQVDQNGKFISAPEVPWPEQGSTAMLLPGAKNIDGPWIIDFTDNWKRANTAPGQHNPGFGQERAKIELWKKPSEVRGKKTKSARRYPFE